MSHLRDGPISARGFPSLFPETITRAEVSDLRTYDLVTARVGMVGAGQLARMSQRAAIDLGIHLEVLARQSQDPGVLVGMPHRIADPSDRDALRELAAASDVLTLDHELVPNELLQEIAAEGHLVRPSPSAVLYAQDKLYQRRQFQAMGFPVPAFAAAPDVDSVVSVAEAHGWPVVLKARRGGYDGRGVVVVEDGNAVADLLESSTAEWYVEEAVDIQQEIAVLVARRPSGQRVTYAVVETLQREGILTELLMPARVSEALALEAVDLSQEIVAEIEAVGVVAVELFVTSRDALVVNELALRPHNSGHATIEATATSQFHNHLRAILDWPLGETAMRAPAAALVNLLGGDHPSELGARMADALAIPDTHVHIYGKEPRSGRKVGHVTALGDTADEAMEHARKAAESLMSLGGNP